MTKSGGLLYAIRAEGTSLVKIGYTRGNVEKRIKAMQTGQPFPLRVIATHPIEDDVRQKEAWLHAFLKHERRRGEWFEMALEPDAFADLIARAIQFGAEQEAQRQAEKERHLLARHPPVESQYGFDRVQLGRRLREARRKRGLTQTALGEQMGVSHGWISEIEAGKQTRLEAETVFRFAEALGISADYLMGLADDPYPSRARQRRPRARDDSQYMPTGVVLVGA